MNKKILFNCFSLAVLGSIFMISDVAANDNHDAAECSLKDLKGSYNISFQGSMVTLDPMTQKTVAVPVAVVGLSIYDGHGNVTSTIEMNVNGESEKHDNVMGTYTMDSNCTGTGVIIDTADLPSRLPPLTILAVAGHRGKNHGIDDFVFTSTTNFTPPTKLVSFVGNGTGTSSNQ